MTLILLPLGLGLRLQFSARWDESLFILISLLVTRNKFCCPSATVSSLEQVLSSLHLQKSWACKKSGSSPILSVVPFGFELYILDKQDMNIKEVCQKIFQQIHILKYFPSTIILLSSLHVPHLICRVRSLGTVTHLFLINHHVRKTVLVKE